MATARPVFMESFHYECSTAANFITQKWTAFNGTQPNSATISDASPRIGAERYATSPGSGGNGRGLYRTLPSTYGTVIIGGWLWCENVWPASNDILWIGEGATVHLGIRGDATGKLGVYRAGTLLGSLSTLTVGAATWAWFEMKANIHDTTGSYELKIGTTSYVSGSGVDTRNAGTGVVSSFGFNFMTVESRFASLFIADATTDGDFLGPSIVYPRVTAEAGNYSQWTPNFGPNHFNVGEIPPDDDQTFNQSSTANQKDTFKGRDLPGSGAVHGYQHVIRARTDGGAHTLRPMFRVGSTDYAGSTVSVPATYGYLLEPGYLNPDTSARFTASEMDGAEHGYELIS